MQPIQKEQDDAIVGVMVVPLMKMEVLGLVNPRIFHEWIWIPYYVLLELHVDILLQDPFSQSVQGSIRVKP